jgi:hypothetical protein
MRVISRILTVLGLLIAVLSNLLTVFGIRQAVNGTMTAESSGIGAVVSGTHSAFLWSHVGLAGCFILIVGLALAALSPSGRGGGAA